MNIKKCNYDYTYINNLNNYMCNFIMICVCLNMCDLCDRTRGIIAKIKLYNTLVINVEQSV